MLDRSRCSMKISVLMAQHVIQGCDAVEVTDGFEILFCGHHDEQKTRTVK